MKFGKFVVKFRIPIVILVLILMIPSTICMVNTRVNYDMLTYLPEDFETVKGQNMMLEEFHKGAFSIITVEGMENKDIKKLSEDIENIKDVASVISYHELTSLPVELLPSKIKDAIYNKDKDADMIAVFFTGSSSEEKTIKAFEQIRKVCNKNCFVSGITGLVVDLRNICEKEEPIYVAIAVILALLIMFIFMDNWIIPIIFILSIGMMILLNLGTNIFFGQISYITKALSAVLQLAVTMDYSIFLWHRYNEEKTKVDDNKEAMALAIKQTFSSVLGSSVTTIAGFIALCFMTFTLGLDLGIVMAKGVLFGILGSVTVLPSIILIFDKLLVKTSHKSILPDMGKFAKGIVKIFPVFIILFICILPPSYYGYKEANSETYYNLAKSLPQDMDYITANTKLKEDFDIGSTHFLILDADTKAKDVKKMYEEIKKVKGVKYVLGLDAFLSENVPKEIIPSRLRKELKNDKHQLAIINSQFVVATADQNKQCDDINKILKKYDKGGMLVGEAPCMKDMINTTDTDFKNVSLISIIAIFIIILIVERSISLPFILIAVIETAIFINLAISHFTGVQLPFIAPICISTIQLGATVDYAILMTTRYKEERLSGFEKKESVITALKTSIPSILVSGLGLFAATFGVAIYSNIDIIKSICMLMARGAVISMIMVIFVLPAFLVLFDKIICYTTLGMKKCVKKGIKNG